MPALLTRWGANAADVSRWLALITVVVLITVTFLDTIRGFILPLVMAVILSAMAMPLYRRCNWLLGGRSNLASVLTIVLVLLAVVLPLLIVAWMAATQATGLTRELVAAVQALRTEPPDEILPAWVPFRDNLLARLPEIVDWLSSLIGAASKFAIATLSAVTRGTAVFLLKFFICIYAVFFFLQMQVPVTEQILRFTGLSERIRHRLAERVLSVSRATIKGTILIGIAQGSLGGLGFWLAGIPGAAFWAVVMGVLSVIPGLGPTFVIFCGVIYLISQEAWTAAVALGIWGAAFVGTIDNILRPILVGRDTQLHDILILTSTLGGLAAFGAVGLVLGPVLAGLFVTIWATLAEEIGADASRSEPRDA